MKITQEQTIMHLIEEMAQTQYVYVTSTAGRPASIGILEKYAKRINTPSVFLYPNGVCYNLDGDAQYKFVRSVELVKKVSQRLEQIAFELGGYYVVRKE